VEKAISRQEMAKIIGAPLEAKFSGFPPVEPAPPPTRQVIVVSVGEYENASPVAVFSSMEAAKQMFDGSDYLFGYDEVPLDPQGLDSLDLR
jgi:hypothetical protein